MTKTTWMADDVAGAALAAGAAPAEAPVAARVTARAAVMESLRIAFFLAPQGSQGDATVRRGMGRFDEGLYLAMYPDVARAAAAHSSISRSTSATRCTSLPRATP